MSFKNIPFGKPEEFNVVVEVPIGSHIKYEYDEKLDAITLDYVFSKTFHWPFNYGYIPRTLGGDGDPLDVFILTKFPLEIGTIVVARPVGMIETLDRGEEDNKIVAVPIKDTTQEDIQDVEDLPKSMLKEFRVFFKRLAKEKNKELEIVAFHGRARALQELREHKK
jgi:inorganic pyrophosphatase